MAADLFTAGFAAFQNVADPARTALADAIEQNALPLWVKATPPKPPLWIETTKGVVINETYLTGYGINPKTIKSGDFVADADSINAVPNTDQVNVFFTSKVVARMPSEPGAVLPVGYLIELKVNLGATTKTKVDDPVIISSLFFLVRLKDRVGNIKQLGDFTTPAVLESLQTLDGTFFGFTYTSPVDGTLEYVLGGRYADKFAILNEIFTLNLVAFEGAGMLENIWKVTNIPTDPVLGGFNKWAKAHGQKIHPKPDRANPDFFKLVATDGTETDILAQVWTPLAGGSDAESFKRAFYVTAALIRTRGLVTDALVAAMGNLVTDRYNPATLYLKFEDSAVLDDFAAIAAPAVAPPPGPPPVVVGPAGAFDVAKANRTLRSHKEKLGKKIAQYTTGINNSTIRITKTQRIRRDLEDTKNAAAVAGRAREVALADAAINAGENYVVANEDRLTLAETFLDFAQIARTTIDAALLIFVDTTKTVDEKRDADAAASAAYTAFTNQDTANAKELVRLNKLVHLKGTLKIALENAESALQVEQARLQRILEVEQARLRLERRAVIPVLETAPAATEAPDKPVRVTSGSVLSGVRLSKLVPMVPRRASRMRIIQDRTVVFDANQVPHAKISLRGISATTSAPRRALYVEFTGLKAIGVGNRPIQTTTISSSGGHLKVASKGSLTVQYGADVGTDHGIAIRYDISAGDRTYSYRVGDRYVAIRGNRKGIRSIVVAMSSAA